jgi:hypothetical protein
MWRFIIIVLTLNINDLCMPISTRLKLFIKIEQNYIIKI